MSEPHADEPYPIGTALTRPLNGPIGFVYAHIGIYIGGGEVIHFNGKPFGTERAEVRRDTLATFAAGQPVSVYYSPECPEHGEAIIDRACLLAGVSDNGYDDRYNAAINNCETFVRDCYAVEYEVDE